MTPAPARHGRGGRVMPFDGQRRRVAAVGGGGVVWVVLPWSGEFDRREGARNEHISCSEWT